MITSQTFTADARFTGLTNSHTLWINQTTGFLYVSGANTCSKGLTIYDIKTPLTLKRDCQTNGVTGGVRTTCGPP